MKNKFLKILSCIAIISIFSCSKKECEYIAEQVACVPTKPEGFMVCTNSESVYSTSTNTLINSGNGVAVIYETTFNATAPFGANWNNLGLGANKVVSISPPDWKTSVIGDVFGIALDNSGNIFLGATNIYTYHGYSSSTYGAGGRSGIYKTNVNAPGTTTTLVTTLVSNAWNYVLTNKIPNSGSGLGNSLGNLAYDKIHNQLFVSNLEDGRIYRIDATTGNVKSVFDPFIIDVPSNGMVAVGEQIWGVGVLTQGGSTSVYFARTEAGFSSIWSVKLNASGEFIATPVPLQSNVYNSPASSLSKEIQKVGSQNTIADIEFSCSGKMLLAERGDAHNSSVFEFKQVGATWVTTVPFFVGGFSGNNSAGGVDYGARETTSGFLSDDIVWASLNYGKPTNNSGALVYGVQGISSSGNIVTTNGTTDLYIDRNNGSALYDKGGIGDVDVFDSNCPCNN